MQKIITKDNDHAQLDEWIVKNNVKRLMLVSGASIKKQEINSYFEALNDRPGTKVIRFSGFSPNPDYESIVNGRKR